MLCLYHSRMLFIWHRDNEIHFFLNSSLLSCSKLIVHNHTKRIFGNVNFRALSSSTGYLIDNPKYSFLKDDLKLERVNPGVYNGKWYGNGPAVKSIGNSLPPILKLIIFPLSTNLNIEKMIKPIDFALNRPSNRTSNS